MNCERATQRSLMIDAYGTRATRSRDMSIKSELMSMPRTSWPRRAKYSLNQPEPQPTSRMRLPGGSARVVAILASRRSAGACLRPCLRSYTSPACSRCCRRVLYGVVPALFVKTGEVFSSRVFIVNTFYLGQSTRAKCPVCLSQLCHFPERTRCDLGRRRQPHRRCLN